MTGRATWIMPALVALLGVMLVVSLGSGAMTISPGQVLTIVAAKIGLTLPWSVDPTQVSVLWFIRLPRVLLAAIVGGSLSVAGAAMQGLFRNALADPGLVGVSSGAALGAATIIVLSPAALMGLSEVWGMLTLPVAAFVGGLGCTLIVYRLSTRNGQTSVATMLLAGIAVNALCGALLGLLTYISDEAALRSLTLWSLGSLGGATWSVVAIATPVMALASVLLMGVAQPLNAMLLGEHEARHLGVDVRRVKQGVVALVALSVGAGVGFTGMIGFVGLVVPHIVRLMVGPDHRQLMPGSALLGASLLLGADLVSRTAVAPAELPIGVITALVGAPFFLALMQRQHLREA
ncbi:MAG: iron ABC transporter permease [Myxococcota bacterium]